MSESQQKKGEQLRVGILCHGFLGWVGGIDFLKLISGSLLAADPNLELHFLLPISGPRQKVRSFLKKVRNGVYDVFGIDRSVYKNPNVSHIYSQVESLGERVFLHLIDEGHASIRKEVRKRKIDFLLPASVPLQGQNVPWIGYLPDLQHCYFPHFFSNKEIAARDISFKKMLNMAPKVMVNSKSVAIDIVKFFPNQKAKVISLPFSAAPDPKWFEAKNLEIEKYGLGGSYFMISNQFWQHKDHLTAWKAFAKFLNQYPDVILACTGDTHDYRNPGFFQELQKEASNLKIEKNLKILGVLPKADQIQLMRNSIAVIQPTLFEGGPGGGSVFDSVSLGVPSIVSDIPVNLELDDPSVVFFKHGDPDSLFQKMVEVFSSQAGRARVSEKELLAKGEERRKKCGLYLLESIKESMGSN